MSLLLHIIAKLIVYAGLAVIVLTLLTWLTRTKSGQTRPPSLGELPEDKTAYVNRISARHPYSSSRRDLKDEQGRRRA
jgi:hypothetical protein